LLGWNLNLLLDHNSESEVMAVITSERSSKVNLLREFYTLKCLTYFSMVRKISSICSKEVYKLHPTSIPVVLLRLAQRTQDKWHQVPFLRREFFQVIMRPMFGAFGKAGSSHSIAFVSKAWIFSLSPSFFPLFLPSK
jgi:hypothetical protein